MKEEAKLLLEHIRKEEESGSDIDKIWNLFKTSLENITTNHIPTKMARQKDKLPWCMDYRAYWSYIEDILTPEVKEDSTNQGTSKRFWTYVKHKKSDKSGVSPLKQHGKLETDPVKQASLLNEQFKSVFSTSDKITSESFKDGGYMKDQPSTYPEAEEIVISEAGVLKLLKNLNAHKAGGPDDIKPTILKELANEMAPILTIIFRKSLESGKLPSDWKKARITPAFKKGKRYSPSNYRPISLTCVCCKIMEHIITSHIMNHAERNSILYQRC
ncbi:hypothetical protein FSP39_013493 [Pinctada imbricata]|uniref:RNA-directed DNA polymerase from mobile element jockey n=1 Tax=Pinctada imbricata TaxID=66713 RepID=A0AA88YXB1_PINIB|nr:hypothetical protein FSP39_013493 [Pinctada imbricata]